MTMPTIDWAALTAEELEQLRALVTDEMTRRMNAEQIPLRIDDLLTTQLIDAGVAEESEWRKPAGGHDAYPRGWKVTCAGKKWESLTPANVGEPGVSGWREITSDSNIPEWVQPSGAHDAYPTSAKVVHADRTWKSVTPDNVWEPGVHGWEPATTTSLQMKEPS